VGLLVLAAILLLFFMSFRVSRLERVKGEVYAALFPSVTGLSVNAAVEVAGVPVGRVERIGLKDQQARVTMRIGTIELHEDAEAIIRTAGVLGDKYVEVRPGSPESPLLPPGGMIKRVKAATEVDQLVAAVETAVKDFGALGKTVDEIVGGKEGAERIRQMLVNITEASSSINEMISENKDKVGTLVANLEEFSRELTPMSHKAQRTLANLDEISTKLRAGEGTLGKLLSDDTLYGDAQETIASFRRVMAKVEGGEGTLGKLLSDDTFYSDAKESAASFRRLMAKVESGEGTLGKFFTDESLYADARETMASFRRVMAKVEGGQGSLGKLMEDESLYEEATKTMKKVQRASERVEETTPVTALGVVLGLFF